MVFHRCPDDVLDVSGQVVDPLVDGLVVNIQYVSCSLSRCQGNYPPADVLLKVL